MFRYSPPNSYYADSDSEPEFNNYDEADLIKTSLETINLGASVAKHEFVSLPESPTPHEEGHAGHLIGTRLH